MAKKKSKLDILPSLTDLYDNDLKLRAFNETNRSEEEIKKEKNKKRAYINEMLSLWILQFKSFILAESLIIFLLFFGKNASLKVKVGRWLDY